MRYNKELCMSKQSRKIKSESMQILLSSHVEITFTDFSKYARHPSFAYFVYQNNRRKFEMDIEPKKFGIVNYTIIMDNGDKISCYARPNAVFFHRPGADDILEIYRTIKLRHLIQNFNKNQRYS